MPSRYISMMDCIFSACAFLQNAKNAAGKKPVDRIEKRGEKIEEENEIEKREKFLISLKCPTCGPLVEMGKGAVYTDYWMGIKSTAGEAFLAGKISAEEAKEKILFAHYRHCHSDYDQKMGDEIDRIVAKFENSKYHRFIPDEIRHVRKKLLKILKFEYETWKKSIF